MGGTLSGIGDCQFSLVEESLRALEPTRVDLTPSRTSRRRQSRNSETTGVRAYHARANDGDVPGSAYLTTDHH